jgi:hypothetical protein
MKFINRIDSVVIELRLGLGLRLKEKDNLFKIRHRTKESQ